MQVSVESEMGMFHIIDQTVGQKIRVSLRSGNSYEGVVQMLGERVLHLSRLEGAEFFDAVIELDDISSIVYRSREWSKN